jgi:hypothetical protein
MVFHSIAYDKVNPVEDSLSLKYDRCLIELIQHLSSYNIFLTLSTKVSIKQAFISFLTEFDFFYISTKTVEHLS